VRIYCKFSIPENNRKLKNWIWNQFIHVKPGEQAFFLILEKKNREVGS